MQRHHLYIHYFKKSNMKLKSSPPNTILTIMLGFIFVAIIFDLFWLVKLSFLLGFVGALSTRAAENIERIWFFLARILNGIIPPILLFVFFFAFLLPIAWINKIFSKHSAMKILKNKKSMWMEDVKLFDNRSMENPW